MDGAAAPIPLSHTVNHLTGEDAILGLLVVSVRGDLDFPALDQVGDPTKGIAHVVVPFTSGNTPRP